ncbi:uncharacterized protein LOC114756516 [Neltuma alba]|uniref:uncharacterized protein LOC114756516 n=1 Tax=Neltuma alba TaxID=207710 RepID=UPI0010A32A4F|nr:uncharacterized protein LOC114756516 [Prosopis alba]
MPKYAKFMKDVLSKKRRFIEFETVALTKSSTDIIKQLPQKMKDPGSFSNPCHIGSKFLGKALCDLKASVNLMPLSIFNNLELGEARPTTVDKFILPADFIVLDCEVDREIPIILGRPFSATARTLIDVEKGELTMQANDEHVTFNMHKLMKSPNEVEQCFFVDLLKWYKKSLTGHVLMTPLKLCCCGLK